VFVDPGAKVDSNYILLHSCPVTPQTRSVTGHNGKVRSPQVDRMQQDGVPSHTARSAIACLQDENVAFIEPTAPPPNSPDLKPVDYTICGREALQEQVYKGGKFDADDELKPMIVLHCHSGASLYTVSQKISKIIFVITQTSTKSDNFWHKDGKLSKII